MSDKQKKADVILEMLGRMMTAFDDVSAAVDEFHVRLKNLEHRKMDMNLEARLDELESTIRLDRCDCSVYGEEITKLTEEVGAIASYFNEIDYERRSAERQRQLLEARAAMGKVRLVPVPVPM